MAIEEILKRVEEFGCDLVEITGGEPLIHKNTPLLIETLLGRGYKVLVETNGSISLGAITDSCIRIMDIKCPSSGESSKNFLHNIDILSRNDEVKFVIADRKDYDFAKDIIINTNLREIEPNRIHLSPVFGKIIPEILASWILEDRLNARLSIQMHKIIWHPDKRGV